MSHDRLRLEGCSARQHLLLEIGSVPPLAMEVCEVGDEGVVLWCAVNVALIVGLCTAPSAVRRKHLVSLLLVR